MALDSAPGNTNTGSQSASEIRLLQRRQLQSLLVTTQRQHSRDLCQNIIKEKAYKYSQHIACYIANDGEIDPALLIEHALFSEKIVYLPILSPLKNSLYFAPYNTNSQLKLNRFNIPEPVCHPSNWKKASQLDLLLLPLVAFDDQGNRMGMGGGFYDQTLSYLNHRQHWKKPVLMGAAHEVQKVDQLEAQSWDIPLNYIATEKQLYNAD